MHSIPIDSTCNMHHKTHWTEIGTRRGRGWSYLAICYVRCALLGCNIVTPRGMTREERRKKASGQKNWFRNGNIFHRPAHVPFGNIPSLIFFLASCPSFLAELWCSLGTCYIPLPELILSGDDLSEGSNNNNRATFAFGEWFYLIEGTHLISETPQMMTIVDQQRFISSTWTWIWELELLLHLFPRYATVDNWLLAL